MNWFLLLLILIIVVAVLVSIYDKSKQKLGRGIDGAFERIFGAQLARIFGRDENQVKEYFTKQKEALCSSPPQLYIFESDTDLNSEITAVKNAIGKNRVAVDVTKNIFKLEKGNPSLWAKLHKVPIDTNEKKQFARNLIMSDLAPLTTLESNKSLTKDINNLLVEIRKCVSNMQPTTSTATSTTESTASTAATTASTAAPTMETETVVTTTTAPVTMVTEETVVTTTAPTPTPSPASVPLPEEGDDMEFFDEVLQRRDGTNASASAQSESAAREKAHNLTVGKSADGSETDDPRLHRDVAEHYKRGETTPGTLSELRDGQP